MMLDCPAPIADATLLDYWAGDLPDADATDRIEEHLFACGACSSRLQVLASVGTGLAALVRQGRVSGIVSRALLNRMQRDGLRIRMFSLAPGETVPCCVFPGDDLIVTAMRADVAAVEAVTLSVTAAGEAPFGRLDDVPVARGDGEVLWATPADVVRRLPSMRLQLTLASGGGTPTELGRYVLEHTALLPPL
jgi:hypothetical protein